MTRLHLFALLLIFTLPGWFASAMSEGQYSLGVLGGQIGLTGDVADHDKAGDLGVGVLAGYSVRDDIFFNLQYHRAEIGAVEHSAFGAGADFYLLGADATRPFLSAGLALLSNTIGFRVGAQNVDMSASAFALYAGGGLEFELTPALGFGLQARYHVAFEATDRVNNVETPIVQDTYSVLARVIYTFGSSKPW